MTAKEQIETALRLERGNIEHCRIRIESLIKQLGKLHASATKESSKTETERQYSWIDSLAGTVRDLDFEQSSMKRSQEMVNMFAGMLANIE